MIPLVFRDRDDAGERLGAALGTLRSADPVVLGLPRGGVPVAARVAQALGAPLDVIVVRKLGAPMQPELAAGAIGEDGVRVVNDDVMRMTGTTRAELLRTEERERQVLERRVRGLRAVRPRESLEGRTALLVDDGIATGATMRAAVQVARAHGARRVVVAAPVAPPEVVDMLARITDEVVVLDEPGNFEAVGKWYRHFDVVTDEQVVDLLREAVPRHREVAVVVDDLALLGTLSVPAHPVGVVVFAHGSGSSRHSPRNQQVAHRLNSAGLATLLFDLLSDDEARHRSNVFDVELLAQRVLAAVGFLHTQADVRDLPVGLFGASTGAAAALWAAADLGRGVGAVVCRGGRPDLAQPRLHDVTAATLMLVGSDDRTVVELNRRAAGSMHCEHRVQLVPGATHLFEEPGALERVADEAAQWFRTRLAVIAAAGARRPPA
ncbi:MAG: hypothetical protein RI900_1023 [Actinomycetota bacterium]